MHLDDNESLKSGAFLSGNVSSETTQIISLFAETYLLCAVRQKISFFSAAVLISLASLFHDLCAGIDVPESIEGVVLVALLEVPNHG